MISAMRALCNPHQPPDVQRAQRLLGEALHEAASELQVIGVPADVAIHIARLVLTSALTVLGKDGADIPAGRLAHAFLDLARLEGYTGDREGRA